MLLFLNLLLLEGDGASTRGVKSADHVEQGALSRTVTANKRDHLSLFDVEGHAPQYLYVSVKCGYVSNPKHHETRIAKDIEEFRNSGI